jgi:Domain of unknown function (DUF5658)
MTLHTGKILLFVLLNVCDLFLTHQLIHGSSGAVIEANPIAHATLACFGWAGLAFFKSAIVLLVSGVAIWLSCHRPDAAGRLLWFACTVLAGVVFYSCSLVGYLGCWTS